MFSRRRNVLMLRIPTALPKGLLTHFLSHYKNFENGGSEVEFASLDSLNLHRLEPTMSVDQLPAGLKHDFTVWDFFEKLIKKIPPKIFNLSKLPTLFPSLPTESGAEEVMHTGSRRDVALSSLFTAAKTRLFWEKFFLSLQMSIANFNLLSRSWFQLQTKVYYVSSFVVDFVNTKTMFFVTIKFEMVKVLNKRTVDVNAADANCTLRRRCIWILSYVFLMSSFALS